MMCVDDTNLRPNLGRFLVSLKSLSYASQNIGVIDEPQAQEDDSVTTVLSSTSGVYQPPKLNPVFYEESGKNKAIVRAKKRAARFVLEDPDVCAVEDLPKEIHVSTLSVHSIASAQFGSHSGDVHTRKRLDEKQRFEEDNFIRLQVTKQEKRMQRCFLSGGLVDVSSKIDHMQVLLQSSDDEVDFRTYPNKKRKKKLKRVRYRKNKCKGWKKRK
ncbi:uncharacterized protein DEA37_0008778 [Paragonimus westermani]|uniref:Uncharacterized protein n=1 Tax=Paragonimus westermani TaxID=34504 RepID=A0A5J4P367_9TREM|nr:uncharacterized protein DEA37_0008778 [Paragonimus westermani]